MKRENLFAALEIGSSKIAASLSERKIDGDLEVLGFASEEFSGARGGRILNLETVAEIIRRIIGRVEMAAGIRCPPFRVSMSSAESRIERSNGIATVAGGRDQGSREVGLPDIKRVIEMANSVSLSRDEVILHSLPLRFLIDKVEVEEPLGAAGVRLEAEVCLVIHKISVLNSMKKVLLKAQVQIEDLTLQTLACAQGVLSEEEKKTGTLLVDIGGNISDYMVFSKGGVVTSGYIDLGSLYITKDLAYGLKTTLAHAEEIKKRFGSALILKSSAHEFITAPLVAYQQSTRVSKRLLAEIIEPRVKEILSLIKAKLDSSELDQRWLEGGIVFTGGGCMLLHIVDLAYDVFQRPARIGLPLRTTSVYKDFHSPRFAVLSGLSQLSALAYQYENPETPLDSLSEAEQLHRQQNIRSLSSHGSFSKMTSYLKNFFR